MISDWPMHSFSIHRQLQDELDKDFEYVHNGGLLVIDDEGQFPFVEAHLHPRAKDGYPLEMIDAKQVFD